MCDPVPVIDRKERLLKQMMLLDPDTVEVVASMRALNRSWTQIFRCFGSHMTSLGIDISS